jgi:hypothetical protein
MKARDCDNSGLNRGNDLRDSLGYGLRDDDLNTDSDLEAVPYNPSRTISSSRTNM